MSSADKIMEVLEELKKKDTSIQAVMVAKAGLEGLIMFPETFKEEAAIVWDPLSKNLDDMLIQVKKYGELGLERSYSELLGYGMCFKTLKASDTALVVIAKGKGLENIRQTMEYMDESSEKMVPD
ncbi:MAG: hypothetical protein KKD39_07215 [Candidatus Altiarchaeota archaeon]|nr:hypothetical protein [Candidatus Altiarchaeota archaeon]